MPSIDAPLGALNIKGPAGMTVAVETTWLDGASPMDLSGGVSAWLGGSTADLDDFDGATEIPASDITANVATLALPISGSTDVLLRLTVDGVPYTVGKLRRTIQGGPVDQAQTIVVRDGGSVTIETLGTVVIEGGGGGGAPTDAGYLVTVAHAGLSSEVPVGATPGGELGGTWAAPTVDATHSGSSHADMVATAAADATAKVAVETAARVADVDAEEAARIAAIAALSGTYVAQATFVEQVQDAVGAMATDGTTVNFTYDDTAGTLTAEVQGLTSANLSDFAEAVRDRLGATLVQGTGITVTVDDPGDTVTIATTITQYTDELAQDAVGGILADSATIDFTYTDGTPEITASVKDGSITADKVAADVATQAELDAVSGAIPSTEAIQDIVGGMVSGGTETGIAVTYDDTNGRLDFVAEVTQAELDAKATLGDWTIVGNVPAAHTVTGLGNTVVRDDLVLTGNAALTIALDNNEQAELIVHQDATGSRVPTWSGVDVWVTRAATPTLATAALAADRFYFERINGVTYGYFHTEVVGSSLSIRKAADETVNNSAALQDDNELTFAIGKGEIWSFEFHLYAYGNTTADVKAGLSVPAGATLVGMIHGSQAGMTTAPTGHQILGEITATDATAIIGVGATSAERGEAVISGTVVNSTTAGAVTLRWAQNSAQSADTIMLAGSYLVARRIA